MSRAENLTHECEDNVTNWHNKNRKRAFDRFHTSLVQYVLIRFGGKDFAKKLTLQVQLCEQPNFQCFPNELSRLCYDVIGKIKND